MVTTPMPPPPPLAITVAAIAKEYAYGWESNLVEPESYPLDLGDNIAAAIDAAAAPCPPGADGPALLAVAAAFESAAPASEYARYAAVFIENALTPGYRDQEKVATDIDALVARACNGDAAAIAGIGTYADGAGVPCYAAILNAAAKYGARPAAA